MGSARVPFTVPKSLSRITIALCGPAPTPVGSGTRLLSASVYQVYRPAPTVVGSNCERTARTPSAAMSRSRREIARRRLPFRAIASAVARSSVRGVAGVGASLPSRSTPARPARRSSCRFARRAPAAIALGTPHPRTAGRQHGHGDRRPGARMRLPLPSRGDHRHAAERERGDVRRDLAGEAARIALPPLAMKKARHGEAVEDGLTDDAGARSARRREAAGAAPSGRRCARSRASSGR